MKLTQLIPPAVEPVTLEEAKLHLRVDVDDDDAYITALISAARDVVEHITRRALLTQQWELALDAFPASTCFELPWPPLQSVEGITYTTATGEQTLSAAAYTVDGAATPGRVALNGGYSWPGEALAPPVSGVRIAFTCGYDDDGAALPPAIRQALLLLIGHLYENREAVTDTRIVQTVPLAFEYLLWPYRVLTF